MGLRLGSPIAGAYSYSQRSQYWRSRRGLTIIFLAFLAIYFLLIRSPDTTPPSSASNSNTGSSGATGSFGGWRSWRASWGHRAADHPSGENAKGWSGPASPLESGLADFKHAPPQVPPGGGDPRLLDPVFFPSNTEEEERKKEQEQAEEAERKKKEEAERKKKEEAERKKKLEEEKKKAEAERKRKKEEEDAQRRKEEGERKAKEEEERKAKEEEERKKAEGELSPSDDNRTEEEKKEQEDHEKMQQEEEARRKADIAENARKDAAEKKKPGNAADKHTSSPGDKRPTNPNGLTTTLVVGRKKDDEKGVKWITDALKDITNVKIYIVDDPKAPLHLNQNKGRESMVYLRYILDHYHSLDDVTLFYHSSRLAWHNNVLMNRDAAVMINNLQREWVVEKGYMNARCELYPGCPQWIKWNASAEETRVHYERNSDLFSEKLWDQLFPNRTHNPMFLSQPCCSQFAVSKDKLRSIPLEHYKILHDWLATTGTFDGYTGRVMEYTWQFLFLGKDEHCPDMQECYCKGYGLCISGDHLKDLKIYNELRSEIDDTLDKLGKWNVDKGCPKLEKDSKAQEECRADNPWVIPLNKIRGKKMALESNMPKQWGLMNP